MAKIYGGNRAVDRRAQVLAARVQSATLHLLFTTDFNKYLEKDYA
jgi:hypothetical protein